MNIIDCYSYVLMFVLALCMFCGNSLERKKYKIQLQYKIYKIYAQKRQTYLEEKSFSVVRIPQPINCGQPSAGARYRD